MGLDLQESAGRQWPLVAKLNFSFDGFGASGVAENAIIMPGNSILIGGSVIITEAFDSVTSDALLVGDSDDDDRYGDAIDAQALGYTALVPTGFQYEGKQAVQLKWTGAGDPPSAGAGILIVQYVIADRANEVQPAVL